MIFFLLSTQEGKNITSLIPIYVKANKNSICLNLILSEDDFFFKKTSSQICTSNYGHKYVLYFLC